MIIIILKYIFSLNFKISIHLRAITIFFQYMAIVDAFCCNISAINFAIDWQLFAILLLLLHPKSILLLLPVCNGGNNNRPYWH